jgi:hypothetical protein
MRAEMGHEACGLIMDIAGWLDLLALLYTILTHFLQDFGKREICVYFHITVGVDFRIEIWFYICWIDFLFVIY